MASKDEDEVEQWFDENVPERPQLPFILVVNDLRLGSALTQLVGERFLKTQQGIWNTEDTNPTLYLGEQLARAGFIWTDEGNDVFWWADTMEEKIIQDWREFDKHTVSPIFLSEEDAREWVNKLQPKTPMWMYAHWGRGVMGPGFKWNPTDHAIESSRP